MKKKYYIFLTIFIFVLLLTACESTHKFSTIGGEYDILLFSDNEFFNNRKEMIINNLSDNIFFTHSESKFKVMKRRIKKAPKMKNYKNIIFIDDIMTTDKVTRYITDVMGRDKVYETKNITIIYKEDLWAQGQTVVFVLFAGEVFTETKIEDTIQKAGEIVENSVQKRIKKELFDADSKKELVKKTSEKVGIEPYIPERYFMFKKKKNFVSVVTRAPDRLLFFYREKYSGSKQINEEEAVELRNKVTQMYYGGDVVFTEMKEWEKENPEKNYFYGFKKINYKNEIICKLQGLWENNKNYRGGVFVTYFYHDKQNKYVYLFDAMLHNPGQNKWPYINKMNLIQKKNVKSFVK